MLGGGVFLGCVLYADDIILFSASVSGLQQMLDICFHTSQILALTFNYAKSNCIVFGPAAKFKIKSMKLGCENINWVGSIKYLGVHLLAGKSCKFNTDPILRSFYSACNCIFSHSSKTDEILQLKLQESYCLPVLTYASAVLSFSKSQLSQLNAAWNSVYRHIFGFNRWDSVKRFIHGLGYLDLRHIIMWRKANFFWKLRYTSNSVLYNISHWYTFVDKNDCWFGTPVQGLLLMSRLCDIRQYVHRDFADLCNYDDV